jgi:hypothetical protein
MTKYELAGKADPRVWEIFESKIEGIEQEKLDKVLSKIDNLVSQGKSLHRAMADALQEYKLA